VITSTQNPKVKYVRALQSQGRFRQEENAFIVEGVRLVEEAFNADWDAHFVLYSDGLNERGQTLVAAFSDRGTQILHVSHQVMQVASETRTPQGLLAVFPIHELQVAERLEFVLIPDAVRDPGNMGTMLRTAYAAGVDVVLIPPDTVDVYTPKVVRAAMGAHFHLPLRKLTWQQIGDRCEEIPLKIYLADALSGIPYNQADFRLPIAVIIGGEAEGVGGAAQQLAEERLRIPMPGGAESLNAAVAAGVLLFEVVRQRLKDS
jgi:TrmH family RNA methyltransferase